MTENLRKDYELFLKYVTPSSKVIDIGCGEGEFLELLKNKKKCKTFGIEIDEQQVSSCLQKGLSAIQGDGDVELRYIPNKEIAPEPFDYAILANSIQVMKHPKEVLEHAKRISKEVLVSSPNFGYFANRVYLGLKGKMPVTKDLSYEWYETPNIHFSTLTDFIALVEKLGFKIKLSYYITAGNKAVSFNHKKPFKANMIGKQGVFILG